jgi:hypothetical protein
MASQAAEKLDFARDFGWRSASLGLYLPLGGAAVYRWWRSASLGLYLPLGGAAVYRCDNCIVLSEALAPEVAVLARKRLFPQRLQPCRSGPEKSGL